MIGSSTASMISTTTMPMPTTSSGFRIVAAPIARRCDRIFPRLWPAPPADGPLDYTQPRQLLARELRFTDPVTGQARCFTSQRQLQQLEVR